MQDADWSGVGHKQGQIQEGTIAPPLTPALPNCRRGAGAFLFRQ